MNPGIITLTTDFGLSGPYVAAVKGILAFEKAPGAQIVDVCHTIAPQNVLEGAFVLANIVDAFPAGTVHVGVVDPGVGTERRLIAVSAARQWFVVPDNGSLITGVMRLRDGRTRSRELHQPRRIRREIVSSTFHGRDILAPAAAHLALGRSPEELGPPLTTFVTLRNFEPSSDELGFVGEVIFKDTFGNLITNIHADRLADAAAVLVAGRDRRGADPGNRADLRRTAHRNADRPGRQLGMDRDRRRQRRCGPAPDRRRRHRRPAGPGPQSIRDGRISRREFLSPITCLTS